MMGEARRVPGSTAVSRSLDAVFVVHALSRGPGAGAALLEKAWVLAEMRAHLALGVLAAGALAGVLDSSLRVGQRRGQDHHRSRDGESGDRNGIEERAFHVSP